MSTASATVEKRGVGRPKRQIDVSKTDELKQLGFTTRGKSNWLYAVAVEGNREFGPATSISALLTLVKKEIGNKIELPKDDGETLEEMTEDKDGNPYISGLAPLVDRQLTDAACAEFADKEAWKEAGKKKKGSKDALDAIAQMKKHLFRQDPDNSSSLIYNAGGIVVRMAKEFTTKISTEKAKEKKDDA